MTEEQEGEWRSSEKNAVLDGHLWLRKSSLSPEFLTKCREQLSVQSGTNNFVTGKPTSRFEVFEEDDEWFGVPPYFFREDLPPPELRVLHNGLERPLTFGGAFTAWRLDCDPNDGRKLYDQEEVVNTVVSEIRQKGSSLLCLDTGMGKTLVALYAIAALGVKTLFIVHKKDSIIQVTKQAQRFLPGVRVGLMRANILRTKDVDIVLTTVQSLSKGKYSQELLNEFGFVIADEIHLMVAEVFHRAFTFLKSRYRLGLTATPDRRDGLGVVIEWFFGPPTVTIRQPRSDIFVRALHYQAGEQSTLWVGNPAYRKPNYAGMVTRLVKDKWRNQLVCQEAVEQAALTTGQVLIMSERTAHVSELADMITALQPSRLEFCQAQHQVLVQGFGQKQCFFSKFGPETIAKISSYLWVRRPLKVASFTGKDSDELRQTAKLADIVIATRDLVKDSLDMPSLTRVIIATPISKHLIQQMRGRLLRITEQETKARGQDLVLSHIADDWETPGMFTGMFWGCNAYYKSEGYKIRHIYFTAEKMELLFPVL